VPLVLSFLCQDLFALAPTPVRNFAFNLASFAQLRRPLKGQIVSAPFSPWFVSPRPPLGHGGYIQVSSFHCFSSRFCIRTPGLCAPVPHGNPDHRSPKLSIPSNFFLPSVPLNLPLPFPPEAFPGLSNGLDGDIADTRFTSFPFRLCYHLFSLQKDS